MPRDEWKTAATRQRYGPIGSTKAPPLSPVVKHPLDAEFDRKMRDADA